MARHGMTRPNRSPVVSCQSSKTMHCAQLNGLGKSLDRPLMRNGYAMAPHLLMSRSGEFLSSTGAVGSYGDGGLKKGERVQLSDVIDHLINLPWQKIASWMVVALLASQLKDFLGVGR